MGERHPTDPPLFYETHVFLCTNRRPDGHPRGCCASKGSEEIKDYMKARARQEAIPNIRINAAGCLDRCELGPCAVIYPEGIWYRLDSREAVDSVIAQHIRNRTRVPALMLPDPS
jgi:(2Fe-2S) ferredoxin